MNTCEKCGSQVPEEKAFCPTCGNPMMPERARTPSDSEEMGETLVGGYAQPVRVPVPPKPTPVPPPPVAKPRPTVKAEPGAKPPAPDRSRRQPPVTAARPSKAESKSKPAADNNRTLYLIFVASAVLFALSVLIIAVLYITGKI